MWVLCLNICKVIAMNTIDYISDATYIKAIQSILENSPVYCGICSFGSYADSHICIEKIDGTWCVYNGDKGDRKMLKKHRNAKEACVDLINCIAYEDNVRDSLCREFMSVVNQMAGGDRHLDPTLRKNIAPGMTVAIVLKEDQPTGKLTTGTIMKILTHSREHYRGIKVMLENGLVGRVQVIMPK